MATNEKFVIAERVTLTPSDLQALKRGEKVIKKKGTNLFGDTLGIQIRLAKRG